MAAVVVAQQQAVDEVEAMALPVVPAVADADVVRRRMALLPVRVPRRALVHSLAPVHRVVVADGDAEHFPRRASLACHAMCQSRT